MGNGTSNSKKLQWIKYRIERKEYQELQKILEKDPTLVNQFLDANSLYSPLMRATHLNDMHLVKLFVEKYKCDVNLKNSKGKTAIIFAINRNKPQVVQYLLENGGKVDFQTQSGLTPLDFAILAGFYEIALLIYKRASNKNLKSKEQYRTLAASNKYRFVNYDILIDNLVMSESPQQVGQDFLTLPKDQYLDMIDPVVDPRQTWKQWASRVYKFENAPLVERQSLPNEIQPQNRKMGWFRQFFDSYADTRKNSRKFSEIRIRESKIRAKSNMMMPPKTFQNLAKSNQMTDVMSQQLMS